MGSHIGIHNTSGYRLVLRVGWEGGSGCVGEGVGEDVWGCGGRGVWGVGGVGITVEGKEAKVTIAAL